MTLYFSVSDHHHNIIITTIYYDEFIAVFYSYGILDSFFLSLNFMVRIYTNSSGFFVASFFSELVKN